MSQVYLTKGTKIYMDDEGYLRVFIKKGARIKLEEAKEMLEIYLKLKQGEKFKQIMEGGSFFSMDEETNKLGQDIAKKHFKAAALIHTSPAIRLLFRFYKMFFRQDVPFEMFANEQQAKKWLKKF